MDNNSITDPANYIRQRITSNEPRLRWRPGGDDALRDAWQAELRTTLARLLGGLPWDRCPLNARVIETREFSDYRREAVLLDTRDGMTAFGYFLTPIPAKSGRQPAVLCVHGHTYGVGAIAGIGLDGHDLTPEQEAASEEGHHNYALQCVRRGYPTFALEQISFGRRADAPARATVIGSSCGRDATAALMLCETLIGWRVWDAMRAIDYMTTRSEVDPDRIAIMGLSGGGTTSFYTACLDTRIALAVVSGYFCTYADSIIAVNHCVDNYIPGILQVAEMPDLSGLIAPRFFFAESGTKDNIFPLPAFIKATERAREIYSAFHVPEKFDSEIFEGDHRFHGVGAFEFLREKL